MVRWLVSRRESRAVVACGIGLVALAAAVAVAYALRTALRPRELAIFGGLVACGLACLEGRRRLDAPRAAARDVTFAWGLPVALLLPPAYAVVFAVPIAGFAQLRVSRVPAHCRLVTAAARGLACVTASLVFHHSLANAATAGTVWMSRPGRMVALVLACAGLAIATDVLLMGLYARLSRSDVFRYVGWGAEAIKTDLVELCIGVLVTAAAVVAVPLAALALPPMLLLQRSLLHAELRAAARTDHQTGLLNASSWKDEAASEIARATRTGGSLALLLVDIDHFKLVNDRYGHLLGDEVLAATAQRLARQLRDYDRLGRLGGDEFAVLLPETRAVEAYRVAERLRARICTLAAPALSGGDRVSVTASVGVALFGTHAQECTGLIAAADAALYRAKLSGRNRVCPQVPAELGPEPAREADAPGVRARGIARDTHAIADRVSDATEVR